MKIGEAWTVDQRFRRRVYATYEDYVFHQKAKLDRVDLTHYDTVCHEVLGERLRKLGFLHGGETVLCLAARIGSEVRAFLDLGCFAVGIDLNPGNQNKYVLYGDFHYMQFPTSCVDVVFTNSLDHAFDVEKLLKEIVRVLKPEAHLIVEAARGDEEGNAAKFLRELLVVEGR